MLRIASVLLMCATYSVNAADMSVDQAVSRLLKDIQQEVEVLKVPIPSKAQINQERQAGKSGGQIVTNGTHRVRRGETLDMVIKSRTKFGNTTTNFTSGIFVQRIHMRFGVIPTGCTQVRCFRFRISSICARLFLRTHPIG